MERPFEPSAHVYDVMYSHLDYPGTAAVVSGIILERNHGASSLLDVACGTGRHLVEWRARFEHIEGIDIDPVMLAIAGERLGDVPVHEADFTSFDLGRRFDAITCMFSSIGYAHTPDRLDAAMAAMADHLSPGGVLVVEPWLLPAMIEPPFLRSLVSGTDDMVVVRTTRHLNDWELDGFTDMEFAYVVTTAEGSEFFTERHVMGVYAPERYVAAAERAGLVAEFLEGRTALGRGLLVGVKP